MPQSQKHKGHNMTNDRNYLRMLSDSELIRLAVDSYNETSIVLAERLSALLDADEQLEELQILYDRLVAENNALRDDMAE
jgi:dynactin complex subunit